MPTATLDPAEAISAAVTEVYDRLRELVDRGPTDDPGLLDEIGSLVRRARGRVTRARKRSADTDQAEPTKPTAVEPSPTEQPAGDRPAAASVPATVSAPTPDRVTVRLADPDAPARPAVAESPVRSAGRHRRQPRMPRWLFLALAVVLAVAGSGVAVIVGNPLPLIAAAPAVGTLHAWRERRLAVRRVRAR